MNSKEYLEQHAAMLAEKQLSEEASNANAVQASVGGRSMFI